MWNKFKKKINSLRMTEEENEVKKTVRWRERRERWIQPQATTPL